MANGDDAHVKNRFSPELALVDPDLADVLRAFLTDPEDCLTRPAAPRLVLTPDAAEVIVPRPATPAPAPVALQPAPPEVRPPPVAVDAPAAPLAPPPSPVVAPTQDVEPSAPAPLEWLPTPVSAEPTARAVTNAAPAAEHPAPVAGSLPVPRRKVRDGRIRTHAAHVVAWVVALGILAVPLLAFVPPSDSLRPTLIGPEPSEAPPADPGSSEPGTAAAPSSPRKQPAAPRQPGRAAGKPKAATKRPTGRAGAAEPATSPTVNSPRPTGSEAQKAPASRPATQGAGRAKRPATQPKKAKTTAPSPATTGKGETTEGKAAKSTASPVTRRLGWEAVTGADIYNIVLVRDGKRIDRWVKTTTLSLVPKTPVAGATKEYRWYVYPLFRKQDGSFRFGELVAEGTANVPSGALGR